VKSETRSPRKRITSQRRAIRRTCWTDWVRKAQSAKGARLAETSGFRNTRVASRVAGIASSPATTKVSNR